VNLLVLVVLSGVILLLWPLWQRGSAAKVRAIAYLRKECARDGLQLLDDTVQAERLRLRWNHGRPLAIRRYTFEFSSVGDDRYPGELVLAGRRVESCTLAAHRH